MSISCSGIVPTSLEPGTTKTSLDAGIGCILGDARRHARRAGAVRTRGHAGRSRVVDRVPPPVVGPWRLLPPGVAASPARPLTVLKQGRHALHSGVRRIICWNSNVINDLATTTLTKYWIFL